MYERMIVGVDGGEGGRDAIAFARELRSEGGQLTLAYVHHGYAMVGRGASPAYEASERDRAQELVHRVRDEAGIESELRTAGAPSVGEGLHRIAETCKADLLVIGSTRRGILGRVLVGDDTWASLDGAPCAVAISPAGFAGEPHLMREVGIAYNGSPESEQALATGRELAAEHHARLSAMEVVSLPTYAYGPAFYTIIPPVDDMLRDVTNRLKALNGVEPHAAYGVPFEELALYSASLDVLVVGSRGYGPVGRLVHGSLTHRLTRVARCPLLVLPRRVTSDAVLGPESSAAAA